MMSTLSYRGGNGSEPPGDDYFPKALKPRPLSKFCDYLLKEQRLIFVVIGMAIASLFFLLQPENFLSNDGTFTISAQKEMKRQFAVGSMALDSFKHGTSSSPGAKVPLGLKRRALRVVVTGGAGFVGSHLVDRLIARGDYLIVVDNFFTGRKENVMHHFGNPRFELIRHDAVEPLLLEVYQIYHLACPASSVHYKHNPDNYILTD